jgi:protein NirF
MVIVEREAGSVAVVDSTAHRVLGRVEGLGLLHHASASFSRDARHAYVVTRDGWLNKVDLLKLTLAKRVRVGESTIGLAVTQDGLHVAVSNYQPGDVRIYRADTLQEIKVLPAVRTLPDGTRKVSRTTGLVDAPGNLLIYGLMDADGLWVVDAGKADFPVVRQVWDAGMMPYDGLLTPDGRYYLAGFYHSPWLGRIDTWALEKGAEKIPLVEPGRVYEKHPVLKVPHLEGWAVAGDYLFSPVVGERRLAVVETRSWKIIGSIPLVGNPVFAVARPDGRQVWVNFGGEENGLVQIVDVPTLRVVKTLQPGRRVFHLQFTPKGEAAYVSANQDDAVVVYDTRTLEPIARLPVRRPSGIFGTDRAHKFGL